MWIPKFEISLVGKQLSVQRHTVGNQPTGAEQGLGGEYKSLLFFSRGRATFSTLTPRRNIGA